MKRLATIARTAAAMAVIAISVVGCSPSATPENPNNQAKKHVLTVELIAPEGYSELPDMTVTVTNPEKELEYTEILKGTNIKDFEVPSGQYKIVVKGKVSNTINLVGSTNSDVYANVKAIVKLAETNKSPLVFKEIYTTSKDWKLNDTYMELVNNSDEVFYLDQVIICAMMQQLKPNPWVDESGNLLDKYPLHGPVVSFPGTGKEHPLEPGQSVVIANDATNWIPENNTVDLTKANWEVYVPNANQKDTDYDAPNLTILYNLNDQRRVGAGFFGGGVMVAKLPEGMTPEEFAADNKNYMTIPNSEATDKYLMMPSQYLLDAVELRDSDAKEYNKLFIAKDDSSEVPVTGWSGLSVRRKAVKVENGRVTYMDTNNSKDDFLIDQPLTPWVHPTSVEK